MPSEVLVYAGVFAGPEKKTFAGRRLAGQWWLGQTGFPLPGCKLAKETPLSGAVPRASFSSMRDAFGAGHLPRIQLGAFWQALSEIFQWANMLDTLGLLRA